MTRAAAVGLMVVAALGAVATRAAVQATAATAAPSPPARRLVSLLPSLTEIVCALGACDRLVATDRYSNWPPRVAALPKAGALDEAQVEVIVALHPDLVLVSRSDRVTSRLHDLGLRTLALDSDRYADIARDVAVVGAALGLSAQGTALNAAIDAAVARVASEAAARPRAHALRVYFEVDSTPYAAGPESFIGELLLRLGARNIVAAGMGPYPKLNPEYVVRADPDVVFTSAAEATRLGQRPGWASIRAVREHRLCTFPAAVYDTIVRPGPRVAEGMQAIAGCLARVAP